MARNNKTFWIFVATLLSLLTPPGFLYWMFYKLDLSSIPQTWYNVISEILLGFGAIYYLNAVTWLFVICIPFSQEVVRKKLHYIIVPLGICSWVALFQAKWMIFGIILLSGVCLTKLVDLIKSAGEEQEPEPMPVGRDVENQNYLDEMHEGESDPLIAHRIEVTRVVTIYSATDK